MTPNTQPTKHPVAHGTFHQTAAQIAAPGSDTSAADVATVGHQNAAPSQEHSARQSSWHTPAGVQRHGASVGLRRLSHTAGRVVYDRTHRGASVGVRRLVGVLALSVAGLGVAACAPNSDGTDAVSGAQSTVERQMSGEYILNPDGTLSKIPVYVHEPELQSNAYTYSAFGAEQAAKHYLALMAYAWETGDTASIRAFVNADTCAGCMDLIERAENLYASGGWAHHGAYTVVEVHETIDLSDQVGIPNSFAVRFIVRNEEAQTYRDWVLTDHPESLALVDLLMHWDGQHWYVYEQEASAYEGYLRVMGSSKVRSRLRPFV